LLYSIPRGRQGAGLGWQKKVGSALTNCGFIYITLRLLKTATVVPKVTKPLSGIASAPNATALDLEPFGRD
jgi:hypothetical protein